MTESERNEGFLRRWSRRKIEASEDVAAPAPAEPTATDADEAAVEEPVAIEDLPDIDTLDRDSDYTVFMRAGVPEELRTLALRKLWRSDPVLANLDGLNDYDEDVGALLESGAEFMKRLADAGEKFTRPGADSEDSPDSPSDGKAAPVADSADGSREPELSKETASQEQSRSDEPQQG